MNSLKVIIFCFSLSLVNYGFCSTNLVIKEKLKEFVQRFDPERFKLYIEDESFVASELVLQQSTTQLKDLKPLNDGNLTFKEAIKQDRESSEPVNQTVITIIKQCLYGSTKVPEILNLCNPESELFEIVDQKTEIFDSGSTITILNDLYELLYIIDDHKRTLQEELNSSESRKPKELNHSNSSTDNPEGYQGIAQ